MSINTLYPDVFHTVLDHLELDDIARLSGANRDVHTMCTDYVPMVSEMTLDSLQHRHCRHQERAPPMKTRTGHIAPAPEPCRVVDKSSVEHGFCKMHLDNHTCWDCGAIREELDRTEACADELGCCYKWVCRLEDGGCVSLQCWSCQAYHDVVSMYKYSGPENRKDRLCGDCVYEHDVVDLFTPCFSWWGISLEEAQRRRGY